jgi:hypothetical protein
MSLDIISLDNDLTIQYKRAFDLGIPVKYLVLRMKPDINKTLLDPLTDFDFQALSEVVIEYYDSHQNISGIVDYIRDNYIVDSRISNTLNYDIAMFLYYAALNERYDINIITDIIQHNLNIDKDQIDTIYLTWFDHYTKDLERDTEIHNTIIDKQNRITSIEPLPYSPFTVTRIGIKGIVTTTYDPIDLFWSSKVSLRVPFIQFYTTSDSSGGGRMYKIYRSWEYQLNYKVIDEHSHHPMESGHMLITVWVGFDTNKLDVGEWYVLVDYDIPNGEIFFTCPYSVSVNPSLISTIISDHLPVTIGSDMIETKIDGNFFVYNVEIVEPIFLDMILNHPIFSDFLYFDESKSAYHNKTRIGIHLKSSPFSYGISVTEDDRYSTSALSSTWYQYYSEGERVKAADNPSGLCDTFKVITLTPGTPYLMISITKALSRRVINQYIFIMSRLFHIYLESKDEYLRFYQEHGSEPRPQESSIKKVRIPSNKLQSKNYQNQLIAPDIFVSDYARTCQCFAQPIIISQDEVESWRRKLVRGRPRQIMYFPKDTRKYIFVCPDDQLPYPGVKRNKGLQNIETYPYLPCCFRTDQMSPDANSLYNEYYHNRPKIRSSIVLSHRITTDKVVGIGRYGYLPSLLVELLRGIINNPLRYGVPVSKNSLIHCILEALDNKDYQDQESLEQKEQYVILVRQSLNEYDKGLYRQELYDLSDDKISSMILDTNRFLDSRLFYRGIEELFNINLYVLIRSNRHVSMEVPRFRYFPIRLHRNRPTIILYRHWGSESDNLTDPHYEIIVDYDVNLDQPIKVFMSNIGELMFNIFRDLNMVYHLDNTNTIDVFQRNYFDQIDIVDGEEIYQYIDDAGKVRSFIIAPSNIVLIIPPTQPEPVRSVDIDYISRLPKPHYNDVFKYINQEYAISIDVNDDGQMIGIWFQGDIYVPIQPSDILDGFLIGPGNPLIYTTQHTDIIGRYQQLKSDVEVILRVILLHYIRKGRPNIDMYFQEYIDIGDGTIEYNTDIIPDIISEDHPLLNNGRIYLYSPKFADGVRYFLKRASILDDIVIPNRVKVTKKYQPDHIVIESQYEFINWIDVVRKSKIVEVITFITQNMSTNSEPYVYQDMKTNDIYLIQNVIPLSDDNETSIRKALTIGYYWKNYHINPGINPSLDESLDYNNMSYVIYNISPSGELQPKTKIGSDTDIYDILDYNNNIFAAILKL